MDQAYFEIKNLKVNFQGFEGKKRVLDIDEIKIQRGEAFGIIGESGTGKTVLALSILQLLEIPPGEIESGEILLDSQDLLKKTEKQMIHHIRGKKISMIFQDPMSTLNPVFTVGQQLEKVIRTNQGMNKSQARQQSLEILRMVELPDAVQVLDKYPHQLSGGQRQRVIIALALSCGAEVIIADEPTRNLDVTIQAGILKLIKNLQRTLNVTVLFIANNPGLVSATCNHAAILYQGKIVERGSTAQVLRSPAHPYTRLLLDHSTYTRKSALPPIEEESFPDACIYYPRCLERSPACRISPKMIHLGEGHWVLCSSKEKEAFHE